MVKPPCRRCQELLLQVADVHHRLELVWADGGYTCGLVAHRLTTPALVLAIVKRSDDMRGFVVLPERWIVKRYFAHLMRIRRLVRDFERRTAGPGAERASASCGPGTASRPGASPRHTTLLTCIIIPAGQDENGSLSAGFRQVPR
ncbi:hypothetical protein [Streptomyces sp. ME08-AFT2]|uniref:hypothetical protein n=1 Tax=Streptomyces sp. ME08-AFT2 TaxID=3028683 RepID=UPI0039F679A0